MRMFSIFARLSTSNSNSPSSPFSDSSRQGLPDVSWSPAFASDPSNWESTFDKCWRVVERILEKKENNFEYVTTYEEMSNLLSQLTRMVQVLMMEVNSQPEPAIGQVLDKFFTQQIMERVLDWAIQLPDMHRPLCQLSLIRVYELIVSESHTQNHCLLVHKPILNPLLRLFNWCKRVEVVRSATPGEPSPRDKHFVLLLNMICTKLAEDRTLLHFFFNFCNGEDQFAVFSLLVPFLYEQNDVGQLARDALLLILSVSASHQAIAEFVAEKSAFCPVVATGLSGCFSQLPRVLAPEGSDRLVADYALESLANFNSSLVFCNAVVQAAHQAVVEKICSFFYSGFLIPVVKPALLQEERESAAACTAYLQVCLEAISEPALLKTIIRMLLIERDEQRRPLIQVVVTRISGGDRLASTSVQLLDTLVQLSCEDVMLVLILRSLLPLRHVTRTQLLKVRDATICAGAAQRLLNCVPSTMLKFKEICSPSTVNIYITEGAQMVERRGYACGVWKWRYDGVSPNPQLFRGDSDDEPGSHTTFSRLSSSRSSMSSATHGLNRYFTSKSAHLTAESNIGTVGHLVELGGSPTEGSLDGSDPLLIEDDEFVLPPINTSSIMSSSIVDYFQLANFDDMSDQSDDPVSSPDSKDIVNNNNRSSQVARMDSAKSGSDSSRGFDTEAEVARSFVLSGWSDVEDMDTFCSILDRQPLPKSAAKTSIAECMNYIDSKVQYYKEQESKPETEAERDEFAEEPRRQELYLRGQPLEESGDSTIFSENLFRQLETLPEHSLLYNLHLISLISSLASYPQPILVAFMFGQQSGDGRMRLFEVLESLKARIDGILSSVEGLDVLVGRALRQLQAKADKADRQHDFRLDSPREENPSGGSPISSFIRNRPFSNSGRRSQGIRYHIHKAVETVETARDDERLKNVVNAAIVLANLCQLLAGIALRQSIVVVPRSRS